MMPPLMEQIDDAVNLARRQAQEFRNLAAATDDQKEGARFLGRAEALCELATEACGISVETPDDRRQLLKRLVMNTRIPPRAMKVGGTESRPRSKEAVLKPK